MDNTADLIDYYEKKNILSRIKILENETPEELFNKIREILHD